MGLILQEFKGIGVKIRVSIHTFFMRKLTLSIFVIGEEVVGPLYQGFYRSMSSDTPYGGEAGRPNRSQCWKG